MDKYPTPIMVTKSFLPPFQEYTKEIERVWSNSWLTNNGIIHQEFETAIKKYLQVNYCTLFVNGHLALESAIKGLKLSGEVITTPFTFASTTHSIVNSGLKPIFCDISVNDFNIDPSKIEILITEKTSAIMPVHVFGNPCNVKYIEAIAQKYNLRVIYDAAHAFGVKVGNVEIGNFGDMSMFSLHATKVFHSIEGGILTYHSKELVKELELYKNFGISGPETVEMVGTNAKMNEFQAAMGLVNLRYIEDQIKKRKAITSRYKQNLKQVTGISYVDEIEGVTHNYSYFPILVNDEAFGKTRDELHEMLKEYNIFTRKYFYPLCTEFDCYKNQNEFYEVPNAHYVANRVLTLPIYSSLSLETVDFICDAIKFISAV